MPKAVAQRGGGGRLSSRTTRTATARSARSASAGAAASVNQLAVNAPEPRRRGRLLRPPAEPRGRAEDQGEAAAALCRPGRADQCRHRRLSRRRSRRPAVRYTIYIYDGANHAFNNDTAAARYNKAAADLGMVAHRGVPQGKPRLTSARPEGVAPSAAPSSPNHLARSVGSNRVFMVASAESAPPPMTSLRHEWCMRLPRLPSSDCERNAWNRLALPSFLAILRDGGGPVGPANAGRGRALPARHHERISPMLSRSLAICWALSSHSPYRRLRRRPTPRPRSICAQAPEPIMTSFSPCRLAPMSTCIIVSRAGAA